MGKTHAKPLAARHGRGTARAQHGHGMLCESALIVCGLLFVLQAVRQIWLVANPDLPSHCNFTIPTHYFPFNHFGIHAIQTVTLTIARSSETPKHTPTTRRISPKDYHKLINIRRKNLKIYTPNLHLPFPKIKKASFFE
jgi:hypothetical protein